MTCLCRVGRLTLPCFVSNLSISCNMCTTCAPDIHNLPIFKGVAASRNLSCNSVHFASKSGFVSAGTVKKPRRSGEYVELIKSRISLRSWSWSAAKICSSASSEYLSRFWLTTKKRLCAWREPVPSHLIIARSSSMWANASTADSEALPSVTKTNAVAMSAPTTVTMLWLLDMALLPPSQSRTTRCPGWLCTTAMSIPSVTAVAESSCGKVPSPTSFEARKDLPLRPSPTNAMGKMGPGNLARMAKPSGQSTGFSCGPSNFRRG
mmetsp:Transcript_12853/g.33357  ORF Transcript_12853/g.33357 Transcript_12853/m.33357 type:complete len:264 (+) Transcript_12853:468-1259(+)